MNLVNTNQPLTMSSREIARVTNKEHFHVKRDIEKMFKELELDVSNFGCTYKDSQNRNQTEYKLNKNLTETLITGYSAKLRFIVIERLHELEAQQAPAIPQSFAEALQLAADQAKQLELAAPKVAFVDNLVNRDNLMNATQVAQKHGLSAKALNKQLEEWKVYNKAVRRARVFQHWFVSKGYGEMKKTESGHDQAMFTNAGEVWINERLTELGE